MAANAESFLFGRKTRERAEFPPLPDDEQELREELQFKEGVIALDVVFDKSGTPFVVEIQGGNAGLHGMEKLDPADGAISDEVRDFFTKWNHGGIGIQNPWWMYGVASDKSDQLAFIPEKNRPRSVVNKKFNHLFEHGNVILKPLHEAQGYGIRIFTPSQREQAESYAEQLTARFGGFIAQSFIDSQDAELAPPHLKRRAASLRVVIPFTMVNGKPEITVHGVGYQRVAPFELPDTPEESLEPIESGGVVNLARGAHAVPMSSSEYARVLPVAKEILGALTSKSDLSRSYRRALAQKFHEKNNDLHSTLINQNETWRPITSVNNRYDQSLETAREVNTFLRYVERELALLSEDDMNRLAQRRVHAYITHSGGSGGTLQLTQYRALGNIDVTYSFDVRNAGALATMLQSMARGQVPREPEHSTNSRYAAPVSTAHLVLPIERV